MVLIPILILASFAIGGTPFTLAIPPILSVALFFSVVVVTVVTVDGRADRRGNRRPLHRHRGDLLVGLRPRDQRRVLAKALIAASGLSLGTLTELAFP